MCSILSDAAEGEDDEDDVGSGGEDAVDGLLG